ncbi:PepSY domain-containing protein [Sulfurimonas sp.]
MVKAHTLHKLAGVSAGILLLILAITGFFLDHDKWNFLYTTTFDTVPHHILKKEKKMFTAYYKDSNNSQHIIVGGHRGLFESFNNGEKFSKISNLQILTIVPKTSELYLATSNGLYSYKHTLKALALPGKYITALSISKNKIVAVIDKQQIVTLDRHTLQILGTSKVAIPEKLLQENIKLSRFVRDLHYGRGLLDGDISLLINDYGAFILTFLALSGYLIWWLIRSKKHARLSRKLIKTHANIFAVVATLPLVILAITGIFLDHSHALSKFMKSITLPHAVLPPVYNSLHADIWSIDYNGKFYRIGNRYGIYKSKDLQQWQHDNQGFAYKMIRNNNILYISGMGAPNRVYKDGSYRILPNTPHMFRDIIQKNGQIEYFSTMRSKHLALPQFSTITLYTLLLTLHDGTFFAPWWIWVNDFAALVLLLLCITGIMRWYKKRFK